MIVFKTFLKVLKSYKFPIFLYSIILIAFCGFNMENNPSTSFNASKPNIYVINEDQETGITKHLMEYLKEHTKVVSLEKDIIKDALFYRDISLIVYIPQNFKEDFLKGKDPEIQIKSTHDYKASLAENILKRYLKIAKIYQKNYEKEEEIILKITETLSKTSEVQLTSKLDTDNLSKMSFYYNFVSYSILAGSIYVICLIMSTFKEKNIRKRTIVSSMNYKQYNRQLLFSNSLLAITLWFLYVLLSVILLKENMFSTYGVLFAINSFVFTLCALSISFCLGNIVKDKNTLNGIVNVIALGSSFLCGVFVPMEWLPESVLKLAHLLSSYYYVKVNERIITLEIFSFETMQSIFINWFILILFIVLFVFITNIVSKRKRILHG